MTRTKPIALTAGALGASLALAACGGGGGPASSEGALTDGKVSSMLGNLLQELKDETKASRTPAPPRAVQLNHPGIVTR